MKNETINIWGRIFPIATSMLVACGGGGDGGVPIGVPVSASAGSETASESEKLLTPGEQNCTVTLYGDSILAGWIGVNTYQKERPARTLKKIRPAYTVYDETRPGESATERLRTFEKENRKSRIIVIQYGVNDALKNQSLLASLGAMTKIVVDEGRIPVITGLIKPALYSPRWSQYDGIARSVSDAYSAFFANFYSVASAPADFVDGLHPTKDHSDRLIQQLAKTLDSVAPECAL